MPSLDTLPGICSRSLSIETIIMFSGLKLGEDLDSNDLNTSVKKLYKTNYFKNIDLVTSDKIITILRRTNFRKLQSKNFFDYKII